ncbi:MAG: rod-binding protein [Planctomycetes bacterium]|nr:rod-binding protein [Planctomycetota bacterium]
MHPSALERLARPGHGDPATQARERAERVAVQFETVFVRTLVGSLRQTASVGGEGMFGAGPGAGTYADWFDQNLAEQMVASSRIGIREQLLADLERNGELPARERLDAAARQAANAASAANRVGWTTLGRTGPGGNHVVP